MESGSTNSLIDVAGIRVGHAERLGDGWRTGVTVVLPPEDGAVAGADVRGAAPGTRETDLLDPRNAVERVHAVVLAGGSAYGLAAATGVMERLASAGVGFEVPGTVVPIVPSAVIFDLGRGGAPRATPDAELGARAYDAAELSVPMGSTGAGTGATTGGLAGGIGTASVLLTGGATVAAVVVANGAGSPLDPRTGALSGARYGLGDEFGGLTTPSAEDVAAWAPAPVSSFNTTIGVVATDLTLTKARCAKLAGIAHDGIARAVRPAHTMVDGDTMFGLATGAYPAPDADLTHELLTAAGDVVSRAIAHAVLNATGRQDAPSYRDAFPSAFRA